MKKLLIIATILFVAKATSQTKYSLPSGYKIYKDVYDKTLRIDKDFDKDGKLDLAIMTKSNEENENNDNYLFVFLSSNFYETGISYYVPITDAPGYNLEYTKQVLTIGGCFGNGRYCESYKFKYYPNLQNMRLIGFDEESFGNAVHDGAYSKSINFITKKMEYFEGKKTIKRINFEIVTLENFDEKIKERLNNLN